MTVCKFNATVVQMHLIDDASQLTLAAAAVHPRLRHVAFIRVRRGFGRGRDMMTLTYALLAAAAFFLWRRKAEWGWTVVLVALALGVVIFAGAADFSQNLGIRL